MTMGKKNGVATKRIGRSKNNRNEIVKKSDFRPKQSNEYPRDNGQNEESEMGSTKFSSIS